MLRRSDTAALLLLALLLPALLLPLLGSAFSTPAPSQVLRRSGTAKGVLLECRRSILDQITQQAEGKPPYDLNYGLVTHADTLTPHANAAGRR